MQFILLTFIANSPVGYIQIFKLGLTKQLLLLLQPLRLVKDTVDILHTPVYYIHIYHNNSIIIHTDKSSVIHAAATFLLAGSVNTRCLSVSCLTYSSSLKIDAMCSSERLLHFELTTWCHVPEDMALAGPTFLTQRKIYNVSLPAKKRHVHHQVKNILLECHIFYHIIQKFLTHHK